MSRLISVYKTATCRTRNFAAALQSVAKDRIVDDLALIDTQQYKAEILVEYRRTLNCFQAITTVVDRHRAMEEQAQRLAEQKQRRALKQAAAAKVEEVVPLAPPTEQPTQPADPVRTVGFKVTAPVSRLRDLKQFLINGGYDFV